MGFVGGLGPSMVGSAGAVAASHPASLSPVSCKVPIGISDVPEVDPKDKSIIVGFSQCTAPSKGATPETIKETCVQVYIAAKGGWKVAAYPGKALGTACNNAHSGVYRYGISKRYVSFDKYRVTVVVSYEGKTYDLHSKVATIKTS